MQLKIKKSKVNIQKTKIMASGPITSWQIDGVTVETVADFIFLGFKITEDGDTFFLDSTLNLHIRLSFYWIGMMYDMGWTSQAAQW